MKFGNLPGTLQACNGTALPFLLHDDDGDGDDASAVETCSSFHCFSLKWQCKYKNCEFVGELL